MNKMIHNAGMTMACGITTSAVTYASCQYPILVIIFTLFLAVVFALFTAAVWE